MYKPFPGLEVENPFESNIGENSDLMALAEADVAGW